MIRFLYDEEEGIGFGFAGDANIGLGPWGVTYSELREARLTLNAPQFMWGADKKPGD